MRCRLPPVAPSISPLTSSRFWRGAAPGATRVGRNKGGFSIESRETLLKGGDNGPAVVLGRSDESELVALVAGLDPENVMPQKGSRLTDQQIGILRAWIDQGASWAPGVSFARAAPRNLEPRRPRCSPSTDATASIRSIRLLAPYYAAHNIPPSSPASDRALIRRMYLDVVGQLPPPDAVRAFVADPRADKRTRLVQQLLADRVGYAEHWLTFWNDLLRNDYRGTGYIDGGREQITAWLYSSLVTNVPFDRFVAQLVDPVPGSAGFSKGIVWRGVVNASQTPEMQAAQNISQVFMGVNLKCASCHDSFVNDWQLSDAYGMASIYADQPLQMVECDKPTGETAKVRFLYPQVGAIDPAAPEAAAARAAGDGADGRTERPPLAHVRQPCVGAPDGAGSGRARRRHGARSVAPRSARLARRGLRGKWVQRAGAARADPHVGGLPARGGRPAGSRGCLHVPGPCHPPAHSRAVRRRAWRGHRGLAGGACRRLRFHGGGHRWRTGGPRPVD